ncbi:hypothetical protein [Aureivirga marina]|uniref:hypothetical protein n=1 Tax=Aureivirga marina TaxID=1182451 RepID=UPI0018C90C31|nr:hypothetical protein [Aureivirga marina]
MEKESKTIAIISYITVFGTVIAFIMNMNKKDEFAAFHIRQMIGLLFLQFILEFLNMILSFGRVTALIIHAILFIFWIIGLIRAINYSTIPIPIIGEYFQRWFQNLK